MARGPSESGTSLIWFATLMTVTVSVTLVLSTAIHQYLFARVLKDYLEQLTLATLSSWDGKSEPAVLAHSIQKVFPAQLDSFQIASAQILAGPTLEIIGCAKWHAPIPVFQVSAVLCQSASAR